MKKLSLFILIVLMLFAFVACSPDSSDSPDDNLLPGEVVPPSESEMVSASDEDIKKLDIIFNVSPRPIDYSKNQELEVTDNSGNTITINTEVECKDNSETMKCTANGKITVGDITYTADNLVVTKSSSGEYKIEEGSALKGESKMEAKDAVDDALGSVINSLPSQNNSSKSDFKSYKFDEQSVISKEKLLEPSKDGSGKEVGSGKSARRCTITQDGSTSLYVYDWTVNETRFQAKFTVNYDDSGKSSTKVYYCALNGKFFDEASCAKLAEYF